MLIDQGILGESNSNQGQDPEAGTKFDNGVYLLTIIVKVELAHGEFFFNYSIKGLSHLSYAHLKLFL